MKNNKQYVQVISYIYFNNIIHYQHSQPLAKVYREGLRSSDDPLRLEESRTKLITYGDWAFSIANVKAWNDLPLDIRMAKTVDILISKFKTHFFQIVYG